MTENIKSDDVVPNQGVSNAYTTPSKNSEIYQKSPDLLKILGGFVIIAGVSYVCYDIIHSTDPDLKQFKQAAFTVLTGFGTGVMGFIFGVFSKS